MSGLNPVVVKKLFSPVKEQPQVLLVHQMTYQCVGGVDQTEFDECMSLGFQSESGCSVDGATRIAVDLIVAFAMLYFVVTCILLLSKLRSYRKLPYTFVQVGLVYNTLQVGFLV